MKTAIYIRVSTDKQTVENQLPIIQDYCKRNNYVVFDIYQDVISGRTDSRPDFDRLINDMRKHRFDCIMVYKLDRIGRSLKHLLQLFEEFRNNKIDFVSVTQNINTSTPEGRMFLHLLMIFAEYERELTVARINDTLGRYKEHLKNEGKFIARDGRVRHHLGRPKGSKDKKQRKKGGYYLRYMEIKKSTP
jgi:DNA invertase Pin-like site-specific DNA recombinase